ncbi:hypothetical protein [Acidithiobacillus thiooxidans]|uniref:hypothetical protein n=1 Tax=Acidithiobacillus thiooxidans TaxID=930 RepID=UPI000466708A|nr:hypothetical protein [Acidithiobacillus thiooxidans]
MNDIQSIKTRAVANMTHSEMGLILGALEHYLPEITALDVAVHTRPLAKGRRVIFWVEGPDSFKAAPILEKMAELMVQRDPYKVTTLSEAWALFGLKPPMARGARLGQKLIQSLPRFRGKKTG